jgi:hypothetical protein
MRRRAPRSVRCARRDRRGSRPRLFDLDRGIRDRRSILVDDLAVQTCRRLPSWARRRYGSSARDRSRRGDRAELRFVGGDLVKVQPAAYCAAGSTPAGSHCIRSCHQAGYRAPNLFGPRSSSTAAAPASSSARRHRCYLHGYIRPIDRGAGHTASPSRVPPSPVPAGDPVARSRGRTPSIPSFRQCGCRTRPNRTMSNVPFGDGASASTRRCHRRGSRTRGSAGDELLNGSSVRSSPAPAGRGAAPSGRR